MDLTVRDLAKLLNVTERTIHRWIEEKDLPAHRLHEQYRFNRVELQEWAAAHRIRVSPDLFAAAGEESALPSLSAAVERGGIHYEIAGATREQALRSVADLPSIPKGIDRNLLYQLLLTRETLSSTGLGGGIAIPHPRNPLVLQLAEPVVLICFLAAPVDFHAIDRQPVRVLFPLLSPSVPVHLRLLSELAHALHDAELRKHLDEQAAAPVILERIGRLEAALKGRQRNGRRR